MIVSQYDILAPLTGEAVRERAFLIRCVGVGDGGVAHHLKDMQISLGQPIYYYGFFRYSIRAGGGGIEHGCLGKSFGFAIACMGRGFSSA